MIHIKTLLKKNEFYLTVILVALCLTIGLINNKFFSVANVVDLMKGTVVRGIMAMGLLVVIISGGIDISFPAIAITCLYTMASIESATGFAGSPFVLIIGSALMGAAMGLVNGYIIGKFDFHPMIVTLGTSRIFYGILAMCSGLVRIPSLGASLSQASGAYLFSIPTETGKTAMPATVLMFVFVIVVVYLLLNKTILGRMIRATGDNKVGAIRAGFPVNKVLLFVYAFSGFTAGLAGICHGIQARAAIPVDLYGGEMMIVAMVVLGGASLMGGKGSVWGNLVGIIIVTITSYSLILMGIPTTWQTFVLGVIILAGTAISSYQQLLFTKRRPAVLSEDGEEGKKVNVVK